VTSSRYPLHSFRQPILLKAADKKAKSVVGWGGESPKRQVPKADSGGSKRHLTAVITSGKVQTRIA
jgi:hypothetical protein